MTPFFQTKRLVVARSNALDDKLGVGGVPRELFVAWLPEDTKPVVTVQLSKPSQDGLHIDWVETCEQLRRGGYARELLQGLEQQLQSTIWFRPTNKDNESFAAKTFNLHATIAGGKEKIFGLNSRFMPAAPQPATLASNPAAVAAGA